METQCPEIELHPTVVESIKTHARQQADLGNYEAVGFVARPKGTRQASATLPLNNHSPDPKHAFFVEPWEQFRAEKKLKDSGYEILGVYHSHVNSEALPSRYDHKLARPGEIVLIYSVVFDDLKGFHESDGSLYPVELKERP